MSKDDNVPNYGKEKPGTEEGGGETEECPTPVQFYHRGEEILQEPKTNIYINNFRRSKARKHIKINILMFLYV